MSKSNYRVIQWATGRLGKIAIRHFAENQAFTLVGAYVSNPEKAGKDAGEIAGIAPTGVLATNDMDAILALDADCVFYSPSRSDVEVICRLLRSGKNVVTSTSFFYPTDDFRAQYDQIEAACREGGTSFHGGGIHPGYAGDLLPLTLARIMNRLDKIEVHEIVNFLDEDTEALEHLPLMGFAIDPKEFESRPNLLSGAYKIFAQSQAMVAEGLGKKIDNVTTRVEVATATKDIVLPGALIPKGTVAAQRHEWTAWSEGKPLIVFYACYTIGDEDMEPAWRFGKTRYRVVMAGDPPTELVLQGAELPGEHLPHPGYTWTAMGGVTAIPAVCEAAPGVVSHLNVGLVRPLGLVR